MPEPDEISIDVPLLGQSQNVIQPAVVPTSFVLSETRDGKYLALSFYTAQGSSFFFFDPINAERVGEAIAALARAMRIKVLLPSPKLNGDG